MEQSSQKKCPPEILELKQSVATVETGFQKINAALADLGKQFAENADKLESVDCTCHRFDLFASFANGKHKNTVKV